MLKRFLVSCLIRLTDIPDAPPPNEKAEDFLAEMWLNVGMRQYLKARESKLRDYLSRGVGGNPLTRAQYILAYGQLQELVNLVQKAKMSYENKQKRITSLSTGTQVKPMV